MLWSGHRSLCVCVSCHGRGLLPACVQDVSPARREKSPAAPARDTSPPPTKLHVGKLTRNVTEEHVREIFSHYGKLVACNLAVDPRVQLPKGYAVVEYASNEDATRAMDYMDGAQLDGNMIS